MHHRSKRKAICLILAVAALAEFGAADAHAGNILWSNSGGTGWLTGTNWTGSATPGTTDVAQFGVNPTGSSTVGISMSSPTNNGTANQAVGAVEVTALRSNAITINNSSATTDGILTLNGATVNGVSDVILRNASGSNFTLANGSSKSMSIALADTTANVVNVDSTGNILISSNISGSGKNLTVNAASSGDLRLSGTNTYDGGTTITGGTSGGRLRIDVVAALPTTGTVAISTGGRLTLNIAGTFGGVAQALTFNPNQTTNPSLDILSGAAVAWQGTVAINADTRIEANGATGSLTFAGNASGAGTLQKQAAGNLILSGTGNGLTGGTQIGNGTLTVNGGSSMGTGALAFAQTSTNTTTVALNNAAQSVGTLSSTWTATTGTIAQTLTLNGTALTVNQATDGVFGAGAVATLSSTIGGTGSLNKSGAAALTFTSANTFTGGTTLSAGTLVAGNNSALGNTGAQTVTFSGGKLASDNDARSLANNLTVNNVAGNQITGANSVTLSGTAGGVGTLEVAMTNTAKRVTVNPATANSFAPDTLRLTSGTLLLGASDRLGDSTKINLNGGTFGLNNFSEGAAGTAGLGSMTLSANSSLDYGTSASGANILAFGVVGSHTASTTLQIINFDIGSDHLYFSGATGDFTGIYSQSDISFNGLSGYSAISYGSYFEIVPVPEPGTVAGALGLLIFVGYRERRRLRYLCKRHVLPSLWYIGCRIVTPFIRNAD